MDRRTAGLTIAGTVLSGLALIVWFIFIIRTPPAPKVREVTDERPNVYITFIDEKVTWDYTGQDRFKDKTHLTVHFVFEDLTQKVLYFKDYEHLTWFCEQLSRSYNIRIDNGGGYK